MAKDQSSQDDPSSSKANAFDMSEFLHVFIEESAEELDHLVESVLILEGDPQNAEALQKAFRMLHTLKGSCGIMGFEVVGNFAHSLEDRFEAYRAGTAVLNEPATTLILKSIDYFRAFIDRLRAGTTLEEDPSELLRAWDALSQETVSGKTSIHPKTPATLPHLGRLKPDTHHGSSSHNIIIHFRKGLQLADLKARLILSRLATIGEVVACDPPVDETDSFEDLTIFSITLISSKSLNEIKQMVEVDGVEAIDFQGLPLSNINQSPFQPTAVPIAPQPSKPTRSGTTSPESTAASLPSSAITATSDRPQSVSSDSNTTHHSPSSDTVRVDRERLDSLMNLTGELVIATATLQQIAGRCEPALRGSQKSPGIRSLMQRTQQLLSFAQTLAPTDPSSLQQWHQTLKSIETNLSAMDAHAELWEQATENLRSIHESVDQLTKVSKQLQRSVLQTRMVPIAPLFHRFKRVVRDLSIDRGKQIHLVILGEKTELDKQMIDALGDPVLHIIRNCIDHGLESPAERIRQGKHAVGTLTLHAYHRGNSVFIEVSDDGAGINIDKVKQKVIACNLATESQLSALTDQNILEFIWQPGFSTADTVTDISGRGVGLDIVRESIHLLNGTVNAISRAGEGTTFSLRLPLTLAIIHSLIVRIRGCWFSIPMDDIREIVSVKPEQIHTLQNCRTIEFRNEWITLASLEHIFTWRMASLASHSDEDPLAARPICASNIVVVQCSGRTLGLCVDELIGRSDIVIKSLAENYTSIPGLSGASILGDGQVCLMLDSMALIELANESTLRK